MRLFLSAVKLIKRKLIAFGLLLIFCTITAIIIERNNAEIKVIETSGEGRGPLLIIDAGHGGADGGTSSKNGMLESEVNLAIAQKLDCIMAFMAYDCVMTRTSNALDYPEGLTIAQKKAWDQSNRISLINSFPNAVLLSIHQNAYPDSRPCGVQVFYSKTDGSKEFAELLQSGLISAFYPESRRLAAPISDKILIMKRAQCPAVLVECGFLSNDSDANKLSSDEYRAKISMVLAASYIQYISA